MGEDSKAGCVGPVVEDVFEEVIRTCTYMLTHCLSRVSSKQIKRDLMIRSKQVGRQGKLKHTDNRLLLLEKIIRHNLHRVGNENSAIENNFQIFED